MGQEPGERSRIFTPWFWGSIFYMIHLWFLIGGLVFWPNHFLGSPSLPEVVSWSILMPVIISISYGGWAHPFLIGLLLGRLYHKRVGGRALFGVGVIGLIIGTNATVITHASLRMSVRHMLPHLFSDLAWAGVSMLIGALLGALPYRRKGRGK